MTQDVPILIDDAIAAHMLQGASISVGACGADRMPSAVRAFGCRLGADRRNISIFVAQGPAQSVLEDILETGRIAVVFSAPLTHRAIQLKGSDASVVRPTLEDLAAVHAYRDAFCALLEPLGYSQRLIRTMLDCADEDLVALRFTPSAIFSQTPGPAAGQALKGSV
ncbi:hypothetical protein [Massilia sp. TS11]|uniref:hypothetical protein n=1 Tax=Massilia sp. TS11 TaxID=2908003 RepID=UPI001EDBD5B6|nr:hypothetical protein [Massilia sp. TS11]MCG2583452.1 hypothetical protein [Massilia sp. TS11]